jgi:hypothetical protein
LPVAPPIDLSGVEAALAPIVGSTPLNLHSVPILALGNDSLRVEQIDSVEAGYQGVVNGRLLMTASVYRNRLKNFITYLLPQVGTSLGRLNQSFGPYVPPSSLPAAAAAAVSATLEAALPPTCSRRSPTMPPVAPSLPCCRSAISARRHRPALNSAQPTCCHRGGRSRDRTPDSIRMSATSPRIRCCLTRRSISSAPGRRTHRAGLAPQCAIAGWTRSPGSRGSTWGRFRAMVSSTSTRATG